MWETPFDEGMLRGDDSIVVNCPTEALERELACTLDGYGLRYRNGDRISEDRYWDVYREDFCYYIPSDGRGVMRGPRSGADSRMYEEFIKCTFYGTEDLEPADDGEIRAFLGI